MNDISVSLTNGYRLNDNIENILIALSPVLYKVKIVKKYELNHIGNSMLIFCDDSHFK
ncbi:Uncharacterised protein [Yersinia intermedia]|jgi:hypothetical protein|uniref:Uncharacterized protein n=1 Tax=Yersinia intermedia TaxID=631 RepID=A0A0H5LT59_YERIN|nr:Uncharacterised protein [Yersinia intermedia]